MRMKFNIEIPNDIILIKDAFVANGHKLFLVGGAVRDALLGDEPKDFDLATDAIPDKVEEILRGIGLRTKATGKAFGVINVFTDDNEFEIATFRSDGQYTDNRRPDSVTFGTIEDDVKRRDLRFNALFFDIDTSEVVDLVGGIEDLQNGIIRTVGNPRDRFNEDKLRILRAIRFAARFGSGLDPEIHEALLNNSSLDKISTERIRDEFLKGLKTAKSVPHFIGLLDTYNLFDWIFRGVDKVNVLPREWDERDPIILMTLLLFENNSSGLKKQLNDLSFTNDEIKGIAFLISLIDFEINKIVSFKKQQLKSELTDEQIKRFVTLINDGVNSDLLDALLRFNLTVSGDFVMDELGVKKGPEVGVMINTLEIENFKQLIANLKL